MTCIKPHPSSVFTMPTIRLCSNLDDLIDFTNTELVKLERWVCANKLSLNINKTGFYICSTKSVTDVGRFKLRNVEINLVNNFNFLGIAIDSNLLFSTQYQNVCNKILKASLSFPN